MSSLLKFISWHFLWAESRVPFSYCVNTFLSIVWRGCMKLNSIVGEKWEKNLHNLSIENVNFQWELLLILPIFCTQPQRKNVSFQTNLQWIFWVIWYGDVNCESLLKYCSFEKFLALTFTKFIWLNSNLVVLKGLSRFYRSMFDWADSQLVILAKLHFILSA